MVYLNSDILLPTSTRTVFLVIPMSEITELSDIIYVTKTDDEKPSKQTNRFPDMTHGTVALISSLFDLSGGIFVFIKMIYDSNLGIRLVLRSGFPA